jgi:hypothetical protein
MPSKSPMPTQPQISFVIEARHCLSRRDKKVLHRLLLTRYHARPSSDGSYSFSIPSTKIPEVLRYLARSAALKTKVVVSMFDPAGLAGLTETEDAVKSVPASGKATAFY